MMEEIFELVEQEYAALAAGDVGALLAVFHPDMVLVRPRDKDAHNPADWECPDGRFDEARWGKTFGDFFAGHSLIRCEKQVVKTAATPGQDGGFAVVDIDILWRERDTGEEQRWLGRLCKTYVETQRGVQMIAQVGPLDFGQPDCAACADSF